jgi:hypothetical protein
MIRYDRQIFIYIYLHLHLHQVFERKAIYNK